MSAIILGLGFLVLGFMYSFCNPEWCDWIAYALPAANLVERGRLATPQLGTFASFDRVWLFHSPLMGLGPVPFYAIMHVGRVPFLAGMFVIHTINFFVVTTLLRLTIGSRSWTLSILAAQAILLHRLYLAFFFTQRYDVIFVSVLALAFFPSLTRKGAVPAWRWLFAGLLPLVHPALVPAAGLWFLFTIAALLAQDRNLIRDRQTGIGAGLMVLCGVLGAVWFARPEGLKEQFFPYLSSMSKRALDTAAPLNFMAIPVGYPYRAVGIAFNLGVIVTSLYLLIVPFGAPEKRSRGERVLARLPSIAILLMTAFDFVRRFQYLYYYILGLVPPLLALMDTPRRRRVAGVLMLGFGVANLAVAVRLEPRIFTQRPHLEDQDEAIALIVRETRPGDRIVLGSPFVLASAPRELPEGRRVVGVVPMPWSLEAFNVSDYRRSLQQQADVYIGDPIWYRHALAFDYFDEAVGRIPRNRSAPLFPSDSELAETKFGTVDVIVVRNLQGSRRDARYP